MTLQDQVDAFLNGSPFAVVGASTNRAKYGNKILRCYQQAGRVAIPVNPRADEIEGVRCYPDLAAIPESVHGVSVITPSRISEDVVIQCGELGIQHIWMQPGAESPRCIDLAEERGISLIPGTACLLVVLGFRDV